MRADEHKSLADVGSGMKDINELLYRNGEKAPHIAVRSYNKAVKEVQFSAGDRVILFSPTGEKEKRMKLVVPRSRDRALYPSLRDIACTCMIRLLMMSWRRICERI